MSRDWRLYAHDIRDKIRYIQNATANLRDISDYVADESIQLSVERAFEIIGEATKHLPPAIKQKYGQIHWKEIAGMRDQIAHGYHKLDDEILWHTAKHELGALKAVIDEILSEHS